MSLSDAVCGTVLVVLAAMTFALVALIVNTDTLPSTVAGEARFFVCWVLSMAFMLRYRRERQLHWFGPAKIRWVLVLRGFLTCGFVTLWWAALPTAPLGDCIAVIYCSPLFTVILSRLILGEKMLAVFPIQALLATSGMCLIIQPPWLVSALGLSTSAQSSGSSNYTLVFAAMCFSCIMPITTRGTKAASWIEVEHVTSFLAVFMLNPTVYFAQQLANGHDAMSLPINVSLSEVGLIALAALGSFAGVAMQTKGYQMADPGKACMFCYLEIPFAYFLQHFGTTNSSISTSSIIGAICVLSSCFVGAVAQLCSSSKEADKEVPLLEESLQNCGSESKI